MRLFFNLFLISLVLLCGCQQQPSFEVSGSILDASGKMLYFEEVGVGQTQLIDSIKLASNGEYSFSHPAVKSPSFYALRLGKQQITLAVDSSEHIQIDSKAPTFATDYTVKNSIESQKIQQVINAGRSLRSKLDALHLSLTDQKINRTQYTDSLSQLITNYKDYVKPFIYDNPRSAVAYFTLFQRVDGLLLFNPNDRQDYSAYGAVATSWDAFYPQAPRSKQLKEITLSALKLMRESRQKVDALENVKEQNFIEIVLPDIQGNNHKLSDMKGKVILLDFTAYESDYSGPYNIALAKIYDRYKDRGFEIYQVSLDPNEHFWKVTAANLPWTTVRDKNSIYSSVARSYNVTNLPTSFLLDRDGTIVERTSSLEQLEEKIKKLL